MKLQKEVYTNAIFDLYSNGVKTQRDEWVYDLSESNLSQKMLHFIDVYQQSLDKPEGTNRFEIKWDPNLDSLRERGISLIFNANWITKGVYRPYVKTYLYFDKQVIGRSYQQPNIFPFNGIKNIAIWWKIGEERPQFALAVDAIPDLLPAGGSICFPLYRYTPNTQIIDPRPFSTPNTDDDNKSSLAELTISRMENITDWVLIQFQKHFKNKTITKLDIFHYVYSVLHHPAYRAKYEHNLKREFPRIPFYDDFWKWAGWGKQLMDLHLNYETVQPYPLERSDKTAVSKDPQPNGISAALKPPAARLIARKEAGVIEVDTFTTLRGVPPEAWGYRLGTYTALEWILERYKERTPKDPTIREKFNTYRFADYKEQVIDLLCRVCTVSVETMKIIKEMPE